MSAEEELNQYLRGIIADAMYMEPTEIQEDELFSNFGLESVTVVRLVAQINEKFGVEVEPRDVLRNQTLQATTSIVLRAIRSRSEKPEVQDVA